MAFTTVESLDETLRKVRSPGCFAVALSLGHLLMPVAPPSQRLFDEFIVYELYDSNGVQHCRRCNIESTPQWRKGPDGAGGATIWDMASTLAPPPGRNTLCNACGVKFANALRKVIGVGAGEYVAGPSEAAKIVRKRQSNHVLTEKNKKYKVRRA